MCRHIARLGPAVSVADVVLTPPNALLVQSYAPRLQRHGRINADGFGVGWYVDGRAEPVRYRRAQPMWTDGSFASVAEATTTGCLLAAVRSATPGFPVEESSAAPFTSGPWLFSHNGRIDDHPGATAKLSADAADVPDARAFVDSALLFALAVARWRAGASLADGLASTLAAVLEVSTGRFNLLATDGRTIAATAYGDTLFTLERDGARVVASEPFDDQTDWSPVPDRSLVAVDDRGITVTTLDDLLALPDPKDRS